MRWKKYILCRFFTVEKYGFSVIDYCNIDVEGGEISVLKSIDFPKTIIKVFTIENNYNTKDIRNHLKPFGYSLITKIAGDEVYELSSKRYGLILNYQIKKTFNYLSILKSNLIEVNRLVPIIYLFKLFICKVNIF